MNTGLDTSVVLRLLIGKPPEQAEAAVGLLNELRQIGEHAAVSDLVVAEAYFALQFHYGVTKADAIKALSDMFEEGEVVATGQAGKVLTQPGLANAKPGFVDRIIHASYAAGGAAMVTFEKSAGKLSDVRVLIARETPPTVL